MNYHAKKVVNMSWQSMDTAHTDGRVILLYRPDAPGATKIAPGWFDLDEFARKPRPFWKCLLGIPNNRQDRIWPPSHWMPMPEPPIVVDDLDPDYEPTWIYTTNYQVKMP